jgi:predicted 3-demethylubiquinone-9 3-methyltransferase (glyoxalase superfamily)
MRKITPCLWFDDNAGDAISFYTSHFANSRVIGIDRYPDRPLDIPQPNMAGKVMNATFELDGFRFMALDGGPIFRFNPSVSFFVHLESRDRIDELWGSLSDGGTVLMALGEYPFNPWYGWVQDRFGVSWQLILAEGPSEQPIVPSMMFVGDQAGRAEEAIEFYSNTFDDSSIGDIVRYGPGQELEPVDNVSHGGFALAGQRFVAMDSTLEHDFQFNEAVSLFVACDDQEEVDRYWNRLSAVPEAEQCGWLKDKFGVSWQIVPRQLGELVGDPDPEKSARVLDAMLKMKKIEVAGLRTAYEGA